MQVKFKIESSSSHCNQFPASNLLSRHGTWESQRFCDYPQQLTVSFYQPVLLKKIKIVSHPSKAPTRINILYHLPEHNDQGFQRYGFLTFAEPQDNGTSSEVKEIDEVNVRANEVRFIFVRCHHNKGNFFSQIGLSGLEFTGQSIDHVIPASVSSKSKGFQSQATLLMQLKQSFIKRQQFQQARQIKQMQSVLMIANEQVTELQNQKQICVQRQDFMGAKKIKEDLMKLRQKVSDLANKFYDPHGRIRMIKSDVALKQKIDQMNLTPTSNSFKLKESRRKTNEDVNEPLGDVGEVTSEDESAPFDEFSQSMVSHDERILPAVINKIKGHSQPIVEASEMADNQFYDSAGENKSLPPEPEPIGPADQANSSVLLQFYQPMFVRKLHSRFWQFRLEAISQAFDELKANKSPDFLSKTRLRAYLFIYLKSLQINSYKTTSTVLDMMDALAQTKAPEQHQRQLHNELEACMRATLKIVGDSNQKIRSHAEKTTLRMIESPVFGVQACYASLIKGYSEKGITRLKKNKLQNLIHLVQKYGIGENAIPHSIADFSMKAASDPEAEVRKVAVELAKAVKANGGKQKIDSYLSDSRIKSSVAKQLEG